MTLDISVDTSVLQNVSGGLTVFSIQLETELTLNELTIIGERTLQLARDIIAFRTGAARESLQIIVDTVSRTVVIGSDGGIQPDGRKIYLRYLELGTSKMIARPFLFPSVIQAINEFKARIPQKVKEMARINVN